MSIGWAKMRVTKDGNFRRLGQFWRSRGREMFPEDPWILCQDRHLSWISSKLFKCTLKAKVGSLQASKVSLKSPVLFSHEFCILSTLHSHTFQYVFPTPL